MGRSEHIPGETRPGSSRRRWPRLERLHDLQGMLITAPIPMVVLDVGFGGFSAACREVPPDDYHQVKLSLRGAEFVLPCRVVHSRESVTGYVVGFEFADRPGTARSDWPMQAGALVDMLTTAVSFD